MTRPIILTAGNATRAGDRAPHGCKALVPLQGVPIIEWQLAALKRAGVLEKPVIVCRSEHVELLDRYGFVVPNDEGNGAAGALHSAAAFIDQSVIVAYADTFFTDVPRETDWMGVAKAKGGRKWYVLHHDGDLDWLRYEDVPAGETVRVGVGLFHFYDHERLRRILDLVMDDSAGEVGMDKVANGYLLLRPRLISTWQDVGDVAAIERWKPSSWQD